MGINEVLILYKKAYKEKYQNTLDYIWQDCSLYGTNIRKFKWNDEDKTITFQSDFPRDNCSHELVDYYGFTDNYKYCKKCNKKESEI